MIKSKLLILGLVIAEAIILIWTFLRGAIILNPYGPSASRERDLLVFAGFTGLVVIIPVIILTFFVAVKYREGNIHAKRTGSDKDLVPEVFWWAIPTGVILLLAFLTWGATHVLDPYRPVSFETNTKPIRIQVVALRWKWLFIYPEQNIAAVNFLKFPVNTPVNFELTADAPMNSFWIPNLVGQMYAMPGMGTKLHMIADKIGDYPGSSAELSGAGFAGMRFVAHAVAQKDFDAWAESIRQSPNTLDLAAYNKLAQASENIAPIFYDPVEPDLYNKIIMKFTLPNVSKLN